MTPLVWSPVYGALESRISSGDDLILIIAPFAKSEALRRLSSVHSRGPKLKVVCRWQPADLVSGASDLGVFAYLKQSGCQLYINPTIHLKLYVFSSNVGFSTSGNLTLRGLGYSADPNIEIGSFVSLLPEDWVQIYRVIEGSRQVDDTLCARLEAFVAEQTRLDPLEIPPDLFPPLKRYTISSLPATFHPAELAEFYFSGNASGHEAIRRATHDLVIFNVPKSLENEQFHNWLGRAFRENPFVIDFVEELRLQGTLRFGAVNSWIHDKCEDVPLPYRWELKENTRIFYDWLAYYVPEISWDTPTYSQVIYWKRSNPS